MQFKIFSPRIEQHEHGGKSVTPPATKAKWSARWFGAFCLRARQRCASTSNGHFKSRPNVYWMAALYINTILYKLYFSTKLVLSKNCKKNDHLFDFKKSFIKSLQGASCENVSAFDWSFWDLRKQDEKVSDGLWNLNFISPNVPPYRFFTICKKIKLTPLSSLLKVTISLVCQKQS